MGRSKMILQDIVGPEQFLAHVALKLRFLAKNSVMELDVFFYSFTAPALFTTIFALVRDALIVCLMIFLVMPIKIINTSVLFTTDVTLKLFLLLTHHDKSRFVTR